MRERMKPCFSHSALCEGMLSKRIWLIRGAQKQRGDDETKRCDEESLQFTNTGQ